MKKKENCDRQDNSVVVVVLAAAAAAAVVAVVVVVVVVVILVVKVYVIVAVVVIVVEVGVASASATAVLVVGVLVVVLVLATATVVVIALTRRKTECVEEKRRIRSRRFLNRFTDEDVKQNIFTDKKNNFALEIAKHRQNDVDYFERSRTSSATAFKLPRNQSVSAASHGFYWRLQEWQNQDNFP
ncbi:hypothetical protein ElyMa_000611800 [Elysia marginata]|uniref:Uncharacterized protein n=1 Tax=Elysia marginata TaxID=1093978 RepID=A0AAV4G9I7_9GAST|nr:hypothetical protein ElyMa_000611800 [Elysia marginata]